MTCKAFYGLLNTLQAYLLSPLPLPTPLEIFALAIIDSTAVWINPFHLPEANLGGFSGISSLIRPSMPPALGLWHISQWPVISCLNIHFLPCSVSLGGQWCCFLITVIFPLAVKMPGIGKPSFFHLLHGWECWHWGLGWEQGCYMHHSDSIISGIFIIFK